MELTTNEKIKLILKRRGMTLGDLAEKTGQSRQNLSNKMRRGNFSESELREIASALSCSFYSGFVMLDTGDKI